VRTWTIPVSSTQGRKKERKKAKSEALCISVLAGIRECFTTPCIENADYFCVVLTLFLH
jgi:hypothetical protein